MFSRTFSKPLNMFNLLEMEASYFVRVSISITSLFPHNLSYTLLKYYLGFASGMWQPSIPYMMFGSLCLLSMAAAFLFFWHLQILRFNLQKCVEKP